MNIIHVNTIDSINSTFRKSIDCVCIMYFIKKKNCALYRKILYRTIQIYLILGRKLMEKYPFSSPSLLIFSFSYFLQFLLKLLLTSFSHLILLFHYFFLFFLFFSFSVLVDWFIYLVFFSEIYCLLFQVVSRTLMLLF